MRLLHLFGLLPLLPLFCGANKCSESSPYFTCHGASVIVIDGTHHMRSHDEIKKEFEYIENHIVSHLGLDKEYEVAFMVSGVCDKDKWEHKYVCSHKEACSELESLYDLAYKHGLEKETLKKIMQQISEHYDHKHPVILFSKSEYVSLSMNPAV
ncbi:hypothetical protein OESDEN_06769 [Oesophagostomum dentatum]|uniref:VWFA domain-containing protein n=1 Tax=Oesophagostomum dentatum TaxID=61180 RepID=A0A0B1T7U9_OESDE|nr:hypothetical protein OESDEN_06769 [Oesophagostomum dentatum]